MRCITYRNIPVVLLILLLPGLLQAQQLPVEEAKLTKQYPQLSLVFNRIFNSSNLDSFYHKLQVLKKNKKGLVKVVHIGDSHLQSDHLPGMVRKGLQDFFGDAGKGITVSKTFAVHDPGKDSSGVLYHTISINGARFETFNQSSAVWDKVKQIQPDLLIVSLGTNDAQAYVITDAELQQQMNTLLARLKNAAPASAILVTTTADSFKNGTPNRELWNLNIWLLGYCTSNNIPVWDMYRVTNGFGSAYNWYRKGMLSGDGVHFTANAYKIQGQLLFSALAKGYNNFVTSY